MSMERTRVSTRTRTSPSLAVRGSGVGEMWACWAADGEAVTSARASASRVRTEKYYINFEGRIRAMNRTCVLSLAVAAATASIGVHSQARLAAEMLKGLA